MSDSVPQDSGLSSARGRGRGTHWIMVLGIALCVGLITWFLFFRNADLLTNLPAVVTAREREIARQTIQKKYGRTATRSDVLFWMADWYLERKRPADAVACFAEIPTTDAIYGRRARFQQGQALLGLQQALAAERQFRELLTLEEQDPTLESRFYLSARQQLRHILEVELRFEERHKLLQIAITRGDTDAFETIAGLFPSHLRWNVPEGLKFLEDFHAVDPISPEIRTALGRFATVQGRLEEAREMLERVVQEFPKDLRAAGVLIACLREADALDEADRRIQALPPVSSDDPWLLLLERGAYSIRNAHPGDAVAVFESLLQKDRTSTQGWHGLAQATRLTGDSQRRVKAIRMATGLGRIQSDVNRCLHNASDPNSFLDLADHCFELELDQEGLVLTEFARKLAPQNPRVIASIKRFEVRMSGGMK